MKNIKNFLLTAFLFMSTVCFSQQSANPLANTEWNGIANIPSPEEITRETSLSHSHTKPKFVILSFGDQPAVRQS